MSPPRVRCAASALYRDRHQATGTWWVVTSPGGTVYDLCSACCLLEFAVLGGLPAEHPSAAEPAYVEGAHDEALAGRDARNGAGVSSVLSNDTVLAGVATLAGDGGQRAAGGPDDLVLGARRRSVAGVAR